MKTVSYKLSIELHKAGFKHKTTHYWIKPRGCQVGLYKGKRLGFIESDFEEDKKFRTERYKAPTLDEMIDALPEGYRVEGNLNSPTLTIYKDLVKYFTSDYIGYIEKKVSNESLADACAKLWLRLKKDGIIK